MIYVFLADGFEEIEAIAPIDILHRAGKQVVTVGVGGTEITGRSNITVTADIEAAEIDLGDELEMIILPGGMPGADNLYASAKVKEAIEHCFMNDIFIGAICAASSILGKMGLLNEMRATCFPGFAKYLAGATVCDEPIVVDRKLVTAKGAGVSIEFALKLTELLCGEEKAQEISTSIQCV
jgi:4-methyl-5(b-hydroxyethyl)-thiazole monophosphate biosynthesis